MKLKLMLLNVGILSLVASGCGQNLNGNYTGVDQFAATNTAGTTSSYVPTGGLSSSMSMQLSQNGDSVTGTWSDIQSGLSGSIQGTVSGGSLSSVIMMPTGTTTTGIGVGVGVGASYYSSCMFTGSLNIGSNNVLSGSLTSSGSSTYSSMCTGVTRNLQLNQTN